MVVAALVAAGIILDARRPPTRQLGARVGLAVVELHRATLGPWLRSVGGGCRFRPSCSAYAERALKDCGLWRALPAVLGRIARCGPWTPAGTLDPWPPPIPLAGAPSPALPSAVPSPAAGE